MDSNDRNKDNSNGESSPKIFPCRFCNKNFSKSQALGGHMNRHRQAREDEVYGKAKALVEQRDGSSSSNWKMAGQSIQSNKYVAAQSYSAISAPEQTHFEPFSPSQLQNRVQIGCSSSFPTYSDQNVGGGISRVGPSLPSSYMNQPPQEQQQGFDQNLAGKYRNPPIPSNPDCQIMGAYPSLAYQSFMNNNVQTVAGASFPYHSSMDSDLQIMWPSFPPLQERDPIFLASGQEAALPYEQQQQSFNEVPSPLYPWS